MLLERDDDLRQLAAALERVATSGRGEVALVAAEAGGGKTSLVRQAAEDAQREPWRGPVVGLVRPPPFAPPARAADRRRLVGRRPAGAGIADGSERQQLFDAAVDALRSSVDTVLLVIEDLHWADDATLDFVTFLARRVVGAPVLLVLTYRDDEVVGSHPTLPVLSEIGASVHVRCRLAPLTEAAPAELTHESWIDLDELLRLTGGNPFFVTETLAAGGVELPRSVAEAVLGRAAHLPGDARRALDASAVVPDRIELWLLDELAGDAAGGVDAVRARRDVAAPRRRRRVPPRARPPRCARGRPAGRASPAPPRGARRPRAGRAAGRRRPPGAPRRGGR